MIVYRGGVLMGKAIHRISNVNEQTKTADCASCGRVTVIKKRTRPNYYRWACKVAIAQQKHPKQPNKGYSKGKCPICGIETDKLVYDHNHKTGAFRGWICNPCNMGLGNFRDDPKSLMRAATYLSQ
jgi:hypothetical protein